MSSPTLPKSGSMRNGELIERPILEPHTAGNEYSSLPTPHAGLGERGRDGVILNPKGQQDLQHTLATLLPTPTVMDMGSNYTPEGWEAWKQEQRAAHNNGNGHGASLTQEALSLLPTPRAQVRDALYKREDYHHNLEEALAFLPTPLAGSMGRNRNKASQLGVDEVILSLTLPPSQTGESMGQQSDDGKLF